MVKVDPEQLTWPNFWRIEPKVAAYLGYHDLGEFRKFRFSTPVLKWYMVFHRFCRKRLFKNALKQLRDMENLNEAFPVQPEHLLEKYPVISLETRDNKEMNNDFRDYIYAGLIYRLTCEIESLSTPPIQPLDPRVHRDFSYQFEKMINDEGSISDFRMPSFNVEAVILPILGPLPEVNESILEKYSRANMIMKSLQYQLAPTKWAETMKNKENAYSVMRIDPAMIPSWMRPAEEQAESQTIMKKSLPPPTAVKPWKQYILQHDRQRKTHTNAEIEFHLINHIQFKNMKLPDVVQINRDPCEYPMGEMWRDAIRRQLKFEALRVDFQTMKLTNNFISSQETLIYDVDNPEWVADWDTVRFEFKRSDSPVTIVYTLIIVPEGEYDLEYHGPVLALANDIILTEDQDVDVAPQSFSEYESHEERPLETVQIKNPEPDQPMISGVEALTAGLKASDQPVISGVEALTAGLEAYLKRLLTDSFHISRMKPIPQALFLESEREEMLLYHNNIDVTTPEGLRKWQHLVLTKACGQVPKLITKGNKLALSSSVEKEVANHEKATRESLLSIEVCTSFQIDLKNLTILVERNRRSKKICGCAGRFHRHSCPNWTTCRTSTPSNGHEASWQAWRGSDSRSKLVYSSSLLQHHFPRLSD